MNFKKGLIVPTILGLIAILLLSGGVYMYAKSQQWPDLKGTFIDIGKLYSSGMSVATTQDVKKVFDAYVDWASQSKDEIYKYMPSATEWRYIKAYPDGIYEGARYWKVEYSYPTAKGPFTSTLDVSEEGEVVGFLRGT